jgi:non-specific serine/threonine protein kinase
MPHANRDTARVSPEATAATPSPIVDPADPAVPVRRNSRHNLPGYLSRFVGRTRERSELKRLFETRRLVTLTGAGGSGKTRLALEVADDLLAECVDGVWLAPLAGLADPALVEPTVAAVLGVAEEPGRPLRETIAGQLGEARMALILDNAEHLLPACVELVGLLLGSCRRLRIVVTSREALGVEGEQLYHVQPLEVPRDAETLDLRELQRVESIQLLLDRVRAVDAEFVLDAASAPALAQICRRLDGIPLALELAAARFRAFPVAEIARRLDDRFRLLTAGSRTALPRHQTLRALVDWSYSHLAPDEQTLLRRLSVFIGGWTLEGAERVGAGTELDVQDVAECLFHLVGKSMVERDTPAMDTAATRYHMLESVREFARERLIESAEATEVHHRYHDVMVELAQTAAPELTGRDQTTWFARLDAERANLRWVLESLTGEPGELAAALELAASLGRYWLIRGSWSEGRRAYEPLLRAARAPEHSGAALVHSRATALTWSGAMAEYQGDPGAARACHLESLELRRALGDRKGVASSLNSLGSVEKYVGDFAKARAFFEESLAERRAIHDIVGMAQSLNNLGVLALRNGSYEEAVRLFEEALRWRRERGDRLGTAMTLHNLGNAYGWLGQLERAESHYREVVEITRELGDRNGMAGALTNLGAVTCWAGRIGDARHALEQALPIWLELRTSSGLGEVLEAFAMVLGREDRHEDAVALVAKSRALRRAHPELLIGPDQQLIERALTEWRASIGDEACERATRRGLAMSDEAAIGLTRAAARSGG